MASRRNSILDKGLPSNVDAERYVLGSILLNDTRYSDVNGAITEDAFSVMANKIIWANIVKLAERGEKIDRVTLGNELQSTGDLPRVGGLSYLVSLDDGLPTIANLDSYVRILVEKWRLRKALLVADRIRNQVLSDEGYTADQITLDGQAALADEVGGFGSSQLESAQDFIQSFPGRINRFLQPWESNPGIPTGLTDIDEACDGFHTGEIFVVGARPGHGKTSFGSVVAKNIARRNEAVAIFTMELSKEMFLHRMICEEAFVSYNRFRRNDLSDGERARIRAATAIIMDMPIYIDDTSGLRVADMRVKLNNLMRGNRKIGLTVADYAQLIKGPKGQRFGTENDKFTAIGEEIKILTKSTGIPMLLLSQLNRESEKTKGDDRPKLAQCRGAGIWEEIAFLGACLYREYVRKRDREDLREKAEFLIEKNRSGPVRSVTLRYLDWLMRFSDYTQEAPPEDTTA